MKKNKTFGIIIATIFILGLIIIGYVVLKNNFANDNENDANLKFNEEEEKEILDDKLEEIYSSLGKLAVIAMIDNYNAGGEYEVLANKDLLGDIQDRQLFVMEQILNSEENYKDFVVIDSFSSNILKDTSPTSDTTYSYYPYSLFNEEYKKYFNEDFDNSKAKVSNAENSYDKNKDYVYYENRRGGTNGLNIKFYTIDDITYNTKDKTYNAIIELEYTERTDQLLGVSSDKVELAYQKNNNQIILKSLIKK